MPTLKYKYPRGSKVKTVLGDVGVIFSVEMVTDAILPRYFVRFRNGQNWWPEEMLTAAPKQPEPESCEQKPS